MPDEPFCPPEGYEPFEEREFNKMFIKLFGERQHDLLLKSGIRLPQLTRIAAEEIFLNGPGQLSQDEITELRYQIWALKTHGRFFFKGWRNV